MVYTTCLYHLFILPTDDIPLVKIPPVYHDIHYLWYNCLSSIGDGLSLDTTGCL